MFPLRLLLSLQLLPLRPRHRRTCGCRGFYGRRGSGVPASSLLLVRHVLRPSSPGLRLLPVPCAQPLRAPLPLRGPCAPLLHARDALLPLSPQLLRGRCAPLLHVRGAQLPLSPLLLRGRYVPPLRAPSALLRLSPRLPRGLCALLPHAGDAPPPRSGEPFCKTHPGSLRLPLPDRNPPHLPKKYLQQTFSMKHRVFHRSLHRNPRRYPHGSARLRSLQHLLRVQAHRPASCHDLPLRHPCQGRLHQPMTQRL